MIVCDGDMLFVGMMMNAGDDAMVRERETYSRRVMVVMGEVYVWVFDKCGMFVL